MTKDYSARQRLVERKSRGSNQRRLVVSKQIRGLNDRLRQDLKKEVLRVLKVLRVRF